MVASSSSRLLGDVLVGDHQVRHHQDVAHRGGIRAKLSRPAPESRESPAANGESALRTAAWPRSMRLASSISPSRVSSGTVPISRRYMRTGIVGLVAEVLGQVQVGELFALFELLVELELGLFQDLDARGVELA